MVIALLISFLVILGYILGYCTGAMVQIRKDESYVSNYSLKLENKS